MPWRTAVKRLKLGRAELAESTDTANARVCCVVHLALCTRQRFGRHRREQVRGPPALG